MRKTGVFCVILPGLLMMAMPALAETVDVKVVTYAELGQTIRSLKGKVVVVDFWGNTCIPCKKAFPHLVEMYGKYAPEGFAAVSVCV